MSIGSQLVLYNLKQRRQTREEAKKGYWVLQGDEELVHRYMNFPKDPKEISVVLSKVKLNLQFTPSVFDFRW